MWSLCRLCVCGFLLCALVPLLAESDSRGNAKKAEQREYLRYQEPPFFSYQELVALSEADELDERLQKKLAAVQTTPFVSNEAWYRGVAPHRPEIEQLGPLLRVVMWNAERGFRLDDIKLLFTDGDAFLKKTVHSGQQADVSALRRQIAILQSADVLVLQELDWGLKRTAYREVAREIGEALDMNWAFGVEFVEVDPISLGREQFEELEDEEERRKLLADLEVDRDRLKAFHGTAIFSRYPIGEARLEPFSTQGYDWYLGEKGRVSPIEKGKRVASSQLFLEKISREIRRGGRTCLYVTLDVPDLPEGRLAVAAPHLENRAKPKFRREQMKEVLLFLRDTRHPVIIAGDMNTTLSDTTPTDVRREVYRRVSSREFWATTALRYATGVGLIYDAAKGAVNFVKNRNDPTGRHVAIFAPNPERGLFDELEEFRFRDGTVIDFRGNKNRTINGTEGTLANSNQRERKGFAVTYQVNRAVGPLGRLKLDWIFVKSYLERPRNSKGPHRFAPHFARTMPEINYALEERLSDHNPVSVDLPFEEPGGLGEKEK